MIYKVRHSTRLSYAAPVAHARYNLRLQPATWRGQRMLEYRLDLKPDAARREDVSGPYWVVTTQAGFSQPLRELVVLSEFTMEVTAPDPAGDGPGLAELREQVLAVRDLSPLAPAPYLFASRIAVTSNEIADWGAAHVDEGMTVVETASAVMSAIYREFTYKPGATDSRTPPASAFQAKRGVCQDFSHVMIIALRALGIPAAYASGYLRTVPPPGRSRLVGADAMHAWVNVWCGIELGWVGFDPTNDRLVHDDHIQIGMGRDYADVSPIDGTFIGSAPQTMTSSVDVQPLHASPGPGG